jgi:hypothetical protein
MTLRFRTFLGIALVPFCKKKTPKRRPAALNRLTNVALNLRLSNEEIRVCEEMKKLKLVKLGPGLSIDEY